MAMPNTTTKSIHKNKMGENCDSIIFILLAINGLDKYNKKGYLQAASKQKIMCIVKYENLEYLLQKPCHTGTFKRP